MEVILFGAMNEQINILQHGVQRSLMPCILTMQEDIHMHGDSSMDKKDYGYYEKSNLQLCNSITMFIGNGVYLWNESNEFICRKHDKDSVT